jgi:hypothetical protein
MAWVDVWADRSDREALIERTLSALLDVPTGQPTLPDSTLRLFAEAAVDALAGTFPYAIDVQAGGAVAQDGHNEAGVVPSGSERSLSEVEVKALIAAAEHLKGEAETSIAMETILGDAIAMLRGGVVDAQPERTTGAEFELQRWKDAWHQKDNEVERLKALLTGSRKLADEIAEVADECERCPSTRPWGSFVDRVWEGVIPARVTADVERIERASKPLSTDVLRNPPDELVEALAGHHPPRRQAALMYMRRLADWLGEHPSSSLSERGSCSACGGKGYDVVQSTRGPIAADRIPCHRCRGEQSDDGRAELTTSMRRWADRAEKFLSPPALSDIANLVRGYADDVERLPSPAVGLTVEVPFERTDRGFKHYPPIRTTYGHDVKVYESSAAESPHVWLAVVGATESCEAHMSVEQAERVRDAIDAAIRNHYQGLAAVSEGPDTNGGGDGVE